MAAPLVKTKTPGVYKRGDRYVVVWRHRGKQHKSSHRTYAEAREAKGQRQAGNKRPSTNEGRWLSAIKAHVQPPPDAGYARRLRGLADAAAQEQAAYRYADEHGFGWRPGPAWLPPQELRDAPWRSSLAPDDVWERFDEAVESLSHARTGVSVVAIAQAFGQLSAAAWGLADAVEQRKRQRVTRAG